jgi:TRAP-type C4-dicarboxylate transport system permease small subunit
VPTLKRASAAAAVVLLATIAWQSWLQARDAMSFGDVTSDLSLPKILYWAPLVFGIAAGAVAAAAMAVKRGVRR